GVRVAVRGARWNRRGFAQFAAAWVEADALPRRHLLLDLYDAFHHPDHVHDDVRPARHLVPGDFRPAGRNDRRGVDRRACRARGAGARCDPRPAALATGSGGYLKGQSAGARRQRSQASIGHRMRG
ncbi:hypothetical protein CEE94_11820, partial [Lactobacillus crispatus]